MIWQIFYIVFWLSYLLINEYSALTVSFRHTRHILALNLLFLISSNILTHFFSSKIGFNGYLNFAITFCLTTFK